MWPIATQPSENQVEIGGHFGCFLLGARLKQPQSGVAWGSKCLARDCTLDRRVVVWRFAVPQKVEAVGAAEVPERPHLRDAVAAEVGRMEELRHPRLCPFLGREIINDELVIVIGYAPGGSIADWLADAGPMIDVPARRVVRATLEGLAYLHSERVPHGSIHGGNVLLGPGAAVRLADFGLTVIRGAGSGDVRGFSPTRSLPMDSWTWLAPELLDKGLVTMPTDIWALGCLMVEMAAGSRPWEVAGTGLNVEDFMADATAVSPQASPPLSDALLPDGRRFVKRCLHSKPLLRPAAADILADPWVAST
eukprot:gnl/TRDRNA2_/TRDRNA2_167146_c2_seq2.p1 gnl/TRDRNA2_/TRDRNA2_167146_c2~~gnl/TRDRNA2_/TRDRNA2_167146_c2_seq2.p1  ORF type:complete len:346 (-),score=46.06 gnl/TRDRNA2_/TRDRNA2_167146_c2_seq2:70-990(-)